MEKYNQIRHAIQELSTQDLETALMLVMLQIDAAVENKAAKEDLFNNLKELYDELLSTPNKKKIEELDSAISKVHIVFGDSVAGSLKLAIKQLDLTDTNKVIAFNEHFAIGPIWRLHEDEGRIRRAEWFRNNINVGYDESYLDMEEEASHQSLMAQIPKQASIVIWCGSNAHEQVGLRYAIYILRNHLNKIYLFNAEDACSRRYNTPDTFISYLQLGEVPVEKLKAVFSEAEDNGQATSEIRQQLENEWLSLAEHNEVLRIWKENKIIQIAEDYYDAYLLETVESLLHHKPKDEFIKAARVVGQAMGYCDQCIGDSYFEFRLRNLIYTGKLEIKGVPRAMRFYSVRLK